MKKLLLILSLFASLSIEAQYVTTFAKNAPETQEDGVFYYLPRNVIKLEFTIEQTDYFIGPYAEFASKLLGTNDFIKENKTECNIIDVDIQLANEVDPNAVYFIASDEKSKEPLPNVILDADGIILAFGYDNIPAKLKTKRNTFIDNELDPVTKQEVSFLEILENDVEREDDDDEEGSTPKKITKEDKAKAALEKISKIRTAYFELVSGFNEVSYGNTTSFMADNMKTLENEYISLFKGKTIKSTYKKIVYVTPENNQVNTSVSIAKLPNIDGSLKIQFESKNTLTNVNVLSDDTKKSSQTNKLFYRIPAESNVKVMLGNKVLAEKPLVISQFGEIRTVVVKNNKVLFNPNTGQIISITK